MTDAEPAFDVWGGQTETVDEFSAVHSVVALSGTEISSSPKPLAGRPISTPLPRTSAFSEMWGHSVVEAEEEYVPPYPLAKLPPPSARPAKSSLKKSTQLSPNRVRFDLPEGTKAYAEALFNNEGRTVPAGTGFPTYSYAALELYQYYQTLCQRKGVQPWDKLLAQIKAASNSGQRLVSLDLRGLTFSRKAAEILGDLLINTTRLRQLNLEHSQLDDDMLKIILEGALFHNRIEWINLAHNRKMRLGGIRYIADYISKNPFLSYVDLSGIIIDKKMAQILAQGVNTARCGIETLRLQECGIKQPVFEILSRGFKTCRIASISFRRNNLPASTAPLLFDYLSHNQNIKRLDLRNNDIKSAGAVSIAQALQRNVVLESIWLWENNIGPDGLAALADALRTNTALLLLDLGYNPLGDAGAVSHLRNVLFSNRKLESLGLASTGINVEGAIAIAEVLPETRSLRSINLSNNKLEVAGLMALSVSMKLNRSVTSLEVSFETNSPDEKRLIDDINAICESNAKLMGQNGISSFLALDTPIPTHSRTRSINEMVTASLTPMESTPSLLDRLREADERASLLQDVLKNLDITSSQAELDLLQELNQQCSQCLRDFSNWTFSIAEPAVKASVAKVIENLTIVTVAYDSAMGERQRKLAETPLRVTIQSEQIELDDVTSELIESPSVDTPTLKSNPPRRRLLAVENDDDDDVLRIPEASKADDITTPEKRERTDSTLPMLVIASATQRPHRGSPPPSASVIAEVERAMPWDATQDDDIIV